MYFSRLQNVNDAATWNQTENVVYMYSVPVIPSNVSAWTAQSPPGLGAIGGVEVLSITPL